MVMKVEPPLVLKAESDIVTPYHNSVELEEAIVVDPSAFCSVTQADLLKFIFPTSIKLDFITSAMS